MNNLLGLLIMVKNEENSIKLTIDSTKEYIKNVIVYDTGSTDKTIEIIRNTCKENGQILHLKTGKFKSFPESRNESIVFAETVNDVKYLLMMDAGDELQVTKSKKDFESFLKNIPNDVNYGLVNQKWLENDNEINDHNDIRFIRNNSNCRYDLDSPVHETFINVGKYMSFNEVLILYQDRMKYGISSKDRYYKDIEILLKAKPTKRNYYFLAQSYMSVNDFKNGFKYNVLSLERKNDPGDDRFTCVRCAFCAMMCNMSTSIIFKYLDIVLKMKDTPIDAYVYLFKVCIENKCIEKAFPYIETVFYLEKPVGQSTLVNNNFYDYTRWSLLSVVCLMSNTHLDLGKQSCIKAIQVQNNPQDLHNLKFYQNPDIKVSF